MTKFLPVLRKAERTAYCRSCGSAINVGTPMISWYSSANRGMHIHICRDCASTIGSLSDKSFFSVEQNLTDEYYKWNVVDRARRTVYSFLYIEDAEREADRLNNDTK